MPFCRKPDRFRQAYVTKIVNQISQIRKIMHDKDWEFRVGDWRNVLENVTEDDFVYLDPPYIGRHTDYYQQWSEDDAADLVRIARDLPCSFAMSMWKENKYRINYYVTRYCDGLIERTFSHFDHVGATVNHRNLMQEALLIKPGYATSSCHTEQCPKAVHLQFNLDEVEHTATTGKAHSYCNSWLY